MAPGSIMMKCTSAFALAAATWLGASGPQRAAAANATVLDTDMNADGLGFGQTDVFAFGAFGNDDTAVYRGNHILVQTQNTGAGSGAGISIPVSNGENGIDVTFDGPTNMDQNDDPPNTTPPNSVFATIGNTAVSDPLHGNVAKLQNGNVLRYSMWVREDPNNPITAAPQIEPVLKFEFWKQALSTSADTNGGQLQPLWGDKIVDTDQHLGQGIWIDVNKNGSVIDPFAASEGRIRTVTTTAWTRIEVTYTVNDSDWFGIGDDVYTVADVEEVRAVMFWGDFAGGAVSGSLWFDNALVEVFANAGAVTPNTNPDPALSEMPVADFNSSGDIDGTDFLIWQRGFGTNSGATTAMGDSDYDGDVDGVDLGFWKTQYGTGVGPAVAAIGAVPEPTTISLLVLALLSGAGRLVRSRS
ncbi:MAG: PEP-CTERM sorting domain-containing protein [Pirellulales bacterium]|nr:PEP-CTERM sorting domain-containing protein [Pirellulales bacterium]